MKSGFSRTVFLFLLGLALASLPVFHTFAQSRSVTETERASLLAGVRVSPSVSAQSAALMEAESGEFLFEKEADVRLPMASTTKIMTALVALEHAAPETVITVAHEAVGTEGSSVYLFEGEQLTLEQLLYALLLSSANDAAVAIAYGVAGGVEPFAALMNEKASSLGLRNTHFTNPHGLDDPDHYTTARELAVIARAALANDLIRKMAATRKTTIPQNGNVGMRLLVNHNKLLRLYDGAIGIKTGFTKRSGRCLVSAAEREGVTLIAVTINAPSDWNDHRAMLDQGFSHLAFVPLCAENGVSVELPVVGGLSETVAVSSKEERHLILPAKHGTIMASVELPRFLYAPVAAESEVGRVVWRMDGQIVSEVPLVAEKTVAAPEKPSRFRRLLEKIFHH
ncbi:MAG: D-alanyl-D-alanine carboxypeptidase [Clostridia bacterium]|nr:D-alanyl-D-alanine carboxypeptidase [Clostridia bacterium]